MSSDNKKTKRESFSKNYKNALPSSLQDLVLYGVIFLITLGILVALIVSLFSEETGEEDTEIVMENVDDFIEQLTFSNEEIVNLSLQQIELPDGWSILNAYRADSIQEGFYVCEGTCSIFEISDGTLTVYVSSEYPVVQVLGPQGLVLESEKELNGESITFTETTTELITELIFEDNGDEFEVYTIWLQSYGCTSNNICVSSQLFPQDLEQNMMAKETFDNLVESIVFL